MSSTPRGSQPPSSKETSMTPVSSTPASFTGLSVQPHWNMGDKILCRYMNSEHYYEAKVIGIGNNEGYPVYSIHYQGWNSRHDEKIPHADALHRFKSYTETDAQKAKEELKKAQQVQFGKNKRKSTATPETTKPATPMSQAKRPKQQATPYQQKPEMIRKPQDMPQIVLPDALRKILIDDENLINKNMFLPKLPARVTVFHIIQDYRKSIDPNSSPHEMYIEYSNTDDALLHPTSENLARSALGLLDYFETTIGSLLLYKFERPMFNDLVGRIKNTTESDSNAENMVEKIEGSKVCFAKQFGMPHFLRMFVRFTEMLSYTHWTDRSLDAIIRHAQDFVMFLSKNHKEYFDVEKDYIVASPDYHKRVWGNQS